MWGWERSTAAGVNSCVHVFIAISTIVNGHLADRVPARVMLGCGLVYLALCYGLIAAIQNPWQAWLCYGILTGWAWGALNLNVFSVAIVNALPERQVSFAIGIANTGSTFGMMALLPLFEVVAAQYGWRTGYIILAIAVGALAVVAVVELRARKAPPPSSTAGKFVSVIEAPAPCPDEDTTRMATTASSAAAAAAAAAPAAATETAAAATEASPTLRTKLTTLFTSRAYWLLSLAFVICGITTTGFIETHIVALAVAEGFDASTGALAFSVLSACNGVGMISAGWLADRVSRTLTLGAIFAIRGLTFLLLLWAGGSPPALFAFAVAFGLVDYSVVPPVISLVGSHAGKHTVGLGVGILLAWHSTAAALGAWMGGEIFERSGSYDAALAVCAVVCFVAALACAAAGPDEPLVRKRPRS